MAAAEWHVRGEMDAAKRSESSFVLFGVTDGRDCWRNYRELQPKKCVT